MTEKPPKLTRNQAIAASISMQQAEIEKSFLISVTIEQGVTVKRYKPGYARNAFVSRVTHSNNSLSTSYTA